MILKKLGFTDSQVEECLMQAPALEVDAIIDWVRHFTVICLQKLIESTDLSSLQPSSK